MAKYTTRFSLKKQVSRFKKRKTNNYATNHNGLLSHSASTKGSKAKRRWLQVNAVRRKKIRKAIQLSLGLGLILAFFGIIAGLMYVQKITKDLPSPDAPFGTKNAASVVYDRNGVQLYKFIGEADRDPLELPADGKLNEVVPNQVIWAFLSAEDINFYQHPGFDITALVNCSVKNLAGTSNCGGSTVTQQLIKQTVFSPERRLKRKVKELVLAMQVERIYTKDQILAMYLTVIPMGGDVYGVNTGARFYFGKELKDLTLGETAILASLPQNPNLSPTLSTNPEKTEPLLKARQNYVLDMMLKHKDKINKAVGDDQFITEAKIETARKEVIAYKDPTIDIKAPHFVFYAKDLLEQRNYNNGKPFTEAELKNGGYKITTTLDYELQKTAERYVKNEGVGNYGKKFGASNAALVTLRPSTGEVLAYVGSKDYNAKKEGKKFDPQMDILTSLQQPGSSAKPITYYNGFEAGVVSPGTKILDIPIKIGNYTPKNSDGTFSGLQTVRYHLVQSRNIPAVQVVMAVGVDKYIKTAQSFGYTTFTDPANYGPAITLGAVDVKPVEHAQSFGVFANGGDFVQNEVVLKITDRKGNVIYQAKPEKKRVADPKAIYMVNDVLKGVPVATPNKYFGDGRDVAAKTGTSNDNRDNWYAFYSPDFVTVGWSGNNDNTPMHRYGGNQAFGSTNTKPWVQAYMNAIMKYFPQKTKFTRPAGISRKVYCSGTGADKVCSDTSDLVIDGKEPPVYLAKKNFRVCDDQQDHIARSIDEATGHAIDKTFTSYTMPVKELQPFADAYFSKKGMGFPTTQCTVDRSPTPGKPWAVISNPGAGPYSGTLPVAYTAFTPQGIVSKSDFYIDGVRKGGTSTDSSYSGSVSLSGIGAGSHTFKVTVTDSTGMVGDSSVTFTISNGNFTITSPGGTISSGPVTVSATYSGPASPSGVQFCISGGSCSSMSGSGNGPYTANWSPSAGDYDIYVRDSDGATSPVKHVLVI